MGVQKRELKRAFLLALFGIFFQTHDCAAYPINDQLSVGGVVAGIYQYQSITDSPGFESQGRLAVTCEPEISYVPTEHHELFVKLGIGAGDGLKDPGRSPFVLNPYGGNVEDDYKNINGRNRDYLLTAWYKYTFTFNRDHMLKLTAGIIDATDYMDENAYANDEFSQFFNEALINGPNAFLPSYDMGVAFEWELGSFSLHGVGMALGSNGQNMGMAFGSTGQSAAFDLPYNFYGIQLGYRVNSRLGEGNYRMILDTTSRDFPNVSGDQKERKTAVLFSFDQQLGDIFGGWLRLGTQDDDAAIVYDRIYSGGLYISGRLWGREGDNIGIGYAHIDGGNQDVEHTDVCEAYGRIAINNILAVTGDVQYMKDKKTAGESPEGLIFGLRLTGEF